ncbi:MAG TPA: ISAs1 family transposase [Anaerolineae bacterium]|nr:ISAs1 family transposase [Anaerolineae bacterium]
MTQEAPRSIIDFFSDIPDPRVNRTKHHPLINIITMAICAVLSGADTWTEIEAFGHAKKAWLSAFLDLKPGIPSHDTFGRVFAQIDPEAFQSAFAEWTQAMSGAIKGVIAIDGKTLRHSYDRPSGKGAIVVVSAWVDRNHLVLGQRNVSEKSHEITAIPALLEMLVLEGCIVTIDAMGAQTAIAAQIINQKGDYILALKGNQGRLHEQAAWFFMWALDVAFREDESRIRTGYAPENMAVLRHMAVNLLKQDTSVKGDIKNKRLRCAWDDHYREKILRTGLI